MLLKVLAEIKSESGKESEIKEFISGYLQKTGYEVIEDDSYIAANPGKQLIVATHLDTVKVKRELYSDSVYVYGTGVCDAKASIAAILEAAKQIRETGQTLNYTLAFFCNEEESGRGSKQFSEKWKWGDTAIVMEPTNLKIASEHWGSFDLDIVVKGKPAHGSMPEFGDNAIEKTCELLFRVKKEMKDFKTTTLKIEGGGDEYTVPDVCRVKLDVRFSPDVKLRDVMGKLSFVREYGEYEVSDAYEGFKSGKASEILERALKCAGLEVVFSEMPSWTDALNLKERYDVVVWGPGELHLCHTKDERVKLEDVEKAKRVLLSLNDITASVYGFN